MADTIWPTIVGGILSMVGGVLGYLGKDWLEKRSLPKIDAYIEANKGSIVDSPVDLGNTQGSARYIRLKVKNVGERVARDCRGVLVDVEEMKNGVYEPTVYRDTVEFVWAYAMEQRKFEGRTLVKGVENYLDICHVNSRENRVVPSLIVVSHRYDDLFKNHANYRLTIQLSAEQADPKLVKVILVWNGVWDKLQAYEEK